MDKKQMKALVKQLARHYVEEAAEMLEGMAAEDNYPKDEFMEMDPISYVHDEIDDLIIDGLLVELHEEIDKLKIKKTYRKADKDCDGLTTYKIEVK